MCISDNTWRNICWDQEDGHHQCQLAQDIFNWIENKYSSYCVNPGPETEFCALIQQDAICINPSGTVVDCSTADSVRLLDLYNNKQRDCWKWHGNMYWHYCDNTVTGNDAILPCIAATQAPKGETVKEPEEVPEDSL